MVALRLGWRAQPHFDDGTRANPHLHFRFCAQIWRLRRYLWREFGRDDSQGTHVNRGHYDVSHGIGILHLEMGTNYKFWRFSGVLGAIAATAWKRGVMLAADIRYTQEGGGRRQIRSTRGRPQHTTTRHSLTDTGTDVGLDCPDLSGGLARPGSGDLDCLLMERA